MSARGDATSFEKKLEIPAPAISHSICDEEARERAQQEFVSLGSLVGCFSRFEKWRFVGHALVFLSKRESTSERPTFAERKRVVYEVQDGHLQSTRNADSDDGSKPQHGTLPKALFSARSVALGVFAENEKVLAWGWIDPSPQFRVDRARAVVRTEGIIDTKIGTVHVILKGAIDGATLIPQAYRLTEEWSNEIAARNQ